MLNTNSNRYSTMLFYCDYGKDKPDSKCPAWCPVLFSKSGPDTPLTEDFQCSPFPDLTLVQWCGQSCFPNLPRPCVVFPGEAVSCQPTFSWVLSYCQQYLSFGGMVVRGGVLSCQHRAQRSGNCKRIISSTPNKLDLSDS